MKRAQSALEFVLITVAMLLVVSVAFIAAQNTYVGVQEERLEQQVNNYFTSIETEIAVAWDIGEGYERDIRIPPSLSGVPYTIDLRLNESPESSDELVMELREEEFFYFLAYPVNGTITHGWHTIFGGEEVQIQPKIT